MSTPERKLLSFTKMNHVAEVAALLTAHPDLDVNWKARLLHSPALHWASDLDHVEIVKLLLAHPTIDVNLKNGDNQTPLMSACVHGRASAVQVLLKDPRVDVTHTDLHGCTPLWRASQKGHLQVVELLIASGGDLGDIESKKG